MNNRILFALIVYLFSAGVLHAQLGKQKNLVTFYLFENVYDSTMGIDIYDKLIKQMGGDSIRYTPKGYVCQGNWEDYYKSGAVIHLGYYVDGQLQSFKNFYENGQVEREFKSLDYTRYQMVLYYPDGKVRSDIIYYQGEPQITKEYFPNGNPEILEEFAKKNEYLMYRTLYFENNKMQSDTRLVDLKKKRYSHKEYHETGNLMEEGTLVYYEEVDNFLKEGTWKVYDENGKQIATQVWSRGQLAEEKKL